MGNAFPHQTIYLSFFIILKWILSLQIFKLQPIGSIAAAHEWIHIFSSIGRRFIHGSWYFRLGYGNWECFNAFFLTKSFLFKVLQPIDSITFLEIVSCIMSTGPVFFYCLFGAFTTDIFLSFANLAYESTWYKFPNDLQKYIRMIVAEADAQRERYYHGFHMVDLNLLTFGKVMQTAVVHHFKEITINWCILVSIPKVMKMILGYCLVIASTFILKSGDESDCEINRRWKNVWKLQPNKLNLVVHLDQVEMHFFKCLNWVKLFVLTNWK